MMTIQRVCYRLLSISLNADWFNCLKLCFNVQISRWIILFCWVIKPEANNIIAIRANESEIIRVYTETNPEYNRKKLQTNIATEASMDKRLVPQT